MPATSNSNLWKGDKKYARNFVNQRLALMGADLDSSGNLRLRRPDGDNEKGLVITQEDTTNNPTGLDINNSGTGNSLYINHDGITGNSINIDAETTTGTIFNLNGDKVTMGIGTLMSLDLISTGKGLQIDSTSAVIAAGELLDITLTTSGSEITAKTGALADISASRTETRTTAATTDNFDVLSVTRTNIMNGTGGTLNAQGSAIYAAITQTATAGTLTDTDYLIEGVETTPTTNALKNVVSLSRYVAGNAAANFGLGISVGLTNDASTDEEWFSVDFNVEDASDGSEEGGLLIRAMTGGAVADIMTLGNDVNIVKTLNLDAAIDQDYAMTTADNVANIRGTINNATQPAEGIDVMVTQLTTGRSSGVVAAIKAATTSLAGDSGGDYVALHADLTDGGGSAVHSIIYSDKAYDFFARASADGNCGMTLGTGMFRDPEGDQEAGYISIDVAGTTYQIPFYASS